MTNVDFNTIKNVSKALVSAKKEMKRPKMLKENKNFGSKYADLNEITRVVEEALQKFDLLLFRNTIPCDGQKIGVQITILHTESGEYMTFNPVYRSFFKQGPQAEASAETYATRAAIGHALNLSLEEDTDANDIQPTKQEKKPAKKSLGAWDNLAQEKKQEERVHQLRKFIALCKERGITSDEEQRLIIARATNGRKERRRDVTADEFKLINDMIQNCTAQDLARVIEDAKGKASA